MGKMGDLDMIVCLCPEYPYRYTMDVYGSVSGCFSSLR
jgi:hypothetical protein